MSIECENETMEKVKAFLDLYLEQDAFFTVLGLKKKYQIKTAKLYRAYSCKAESHFIEREFTLKRGGILVPQPRPIIGYDLWNMDGFKREGTYELPILETCFDQKCKTCGGTGKLSCQKCGKSGKMVCPECRGKKVYTCRICGGSKERNCNASGCLSGKVKCRVCNVDGEVKKSRLKNCSHCSGTGYDQYKYNYKCEECGGSGQVQDYYYDKCPSCHGKKYLTCTYCHGTGKIRCNECDVYGEVHCRTCHENGKVRCTNCEGKGYNVCKNCNGDGHYIQTYHLKQNDRTESSEKFWYDDDFPLAKRPGTLDSYAGEEIKVAESLNPSLDETCNPEKVLPECSQLIEAWKEGVFSYSDKKRFQYKKQRIEYKYYDCFAACKFEYAGRQYDVWIDFASGEVLEEGCSLRDENLSKVLAKNDADLKKIRNRFNRREKWHCFKAFLYRVLLMPQWAIAEYIKAESVSYYDEETYSSIYSNETREKQLKGIVFRTMFLYLAGMLFSVWCFKESFCFSFGHSRDLMLHIYSGLCSINIILLVWLVWLRVNYRVVCGGLGCFGLGWLIVWSFQPQELFLQLNDVWRYGVCGVYGVLLILLLVLLSKGPLSFMNNCRVAQAWENIGRVDFPFSRLAELDLLKKCTTKKITTVLTVLFLVAHFFAWIAISTIVKTNGLLTLETFSQQAYVQLFDRVNSLTTFFQVKARSHEDKRCADDIEKGKKKDLNKAKRYYILAQQYEDPKSKKLSIAKAYEFYQTSSRMGYKEAENSCRRIARAAQAWNQAHAGDGNAAYTLYLCYKDGIGVPKNEDVAKKWLITSYKNGSRDAAYCVAEIWLRGSNDREYAGAIKLLQEAVSDKHIQSMVLLGKCFRDGRGVVKDLAKATALWRQAGNLGSAEGLFLLGKYEYERSKGFFSDDNLLLAIKILTQAADRGSTEAMMFLGRYYAEGKGMFSSGKDLSKAVFFYERAQKAGVKEAGTALDAISRNK